MKLQYVAVPLFAALGVVSGCGSSSGVQPARAIPAPSTASVAGTPSAAAVTTMSPVVRPKPVPLRASTVYVTPQPERTVYVLPTTGPTTVTETVPNTGVGGVDGVNVYPINSAGSLVNVRVNPSIGSALVGTLVQDQYVQISCTQFGDAVTGPWGTTRLWDHIDAPYYGYVSDMWVNTASGTPVVGAC